jgi:flagellar motor switch protein FliG
MTVDKTLRKAAILIDSIDAKSADALLEQMGPQQAARVRSAVLELPEVSAAERERVIAEFLGRAPTTSAPHGRAADGDQGLELDASLTSKFGLPDPVSARKQAPLVEALAARSSASAPQGSTLSNPRPFDFLHATTPVSLSALLACEHPQTAALVVAHLSPHHAAQVIKAFSREFQAEVVRRMIDLEETSPEILAEVERQIQSLLSHELRSSRRREAGMATVGAILAAAGGSGREAILDNLAGFDDRLAKRLDEVTEETAVVPAGNRWRRQLQRSSPAGELGDAAKEESGLLQTRLAAANTAAASASEQRATAKARSAASHSAPSADPPASPDAALEFDDLLELDDRSLVSVLSAAQAELAILALTGAPQRLVDRVLKQLPRREAKKLRTRLGQTGPLRLRDIERAQSQLARVATRLAAEGGIRIPKRVRRFAAAA